MPHEHVILLHGLCRTHRCMLPMERALLKAGYAVHNIGYDSRSAPIQTLTDAVLPPAVARCTAAGATTIHFVAHSLGGILIRCYLAKENPKELGRVVMLGPPNQGSEVVDWLGALSLFSLINGPAGRELGTDPGSVPNQLGPANFPLGVIAGNRSINWINSLAIPGPDDGKVAVERTKLPGMADHIVLPVMHPFLMKNRAAIRQTISFLRTGKFER